MPEDSHDEMESAAPPEEEAGEVWTEEGQPEGVIEEGELQEAADGEEAQTAEEGAEAIEHEAEVLEATEGGGEPEGGDPVAGEEPLLQPCTNCATLLDVTDLEPFAKVHCPICGTAIRARTQLKNFTLQEVLGAGGMGAVYRALDTNLNRMVALKVVRKEYSAQAEYVEKFEREARITASVNHPNVVKVYSFGSDHGLFYIAMELVDKGSLDDLMGLQGRVAEVQALTVGIQVAQGLCAAHQKGLIHRDVKPGNILFADAQTAKIVDFGLALLAEHEAEERGEVWGTPYYVAPEKLDHQPEDFRSDIYSLGGTLFHAISGRPPFEAESASLVALKHLKSRPVSLQAFAPDVSSATAYVINRMLHKDPDQRYQSYEELIEHLEYARSQLLATPAGARKAKERVVIEGKDQQKVTGIVTAVLLLMVLGIGGALFVYRDRIFHHDEAGGGDEAQTAAQRMQDELVAARKQIVAGDYAGATAALEKLNDEPDLLQPLQNWVTVHQGLVSLLQENVPDAEGSFHVVANRSHYSSDPADAALVNLFSRLGTTLSRAGGVMPSEGRSFSPATADAIAPLLFALKDWAEGRFQDAAQMLGMYLAAAPTEPFAWVGDFKPLAQRYANDEAAYEQVAVAARTADTPVKRAAAIQAAEELKGKAAGGPAGMLGRVLEGIAADLRRRSAELDPIYNARMAAAAKADAEALEAARMQYAAYCGRFQFAEAHTAMEAVRVTTPDGAREREGLVKKAEWLREFKEQLIADINAHGYTNSVIDRAGSLVPPGERRANEEGLLVRTPYGTTPFPWTTLPTSEVLAMASCFEAYGTRETAAQRRWLSGVFACEEGMARDGHTLLVEASQTRDEYKNELGLFLSGD